MKKTLVKLGVLAAALALALVVVSCEQPTDEGSSGPGSPTIIRLYLDRDDQTLEVGDRVEIRVAQKLLIPAVGAVPAANPTGYANYPYPQAVRAGSPVLNTGKTNTDPIQDPDRDELFAVPARRANDAPSVLLTVDPKSTFVTSGRKVLTAPLTVDPTTQIGSSSGSSIQVNAKGIYYVDFELIDQTVASKDRGSVYSKSLSGYVELTLGSGGTNSPRPLGLTYAADPRLPDATYMYTKDAHGFNAKDGAMDGANVVWKVDNKNIKKFSLKPGINELYLSYFSYHQFEN